MGAFLSSADSNIALMALVLGACLALAWLAYAHRRPLIGFCAIMVWVPFMPVAPKEIGATELVFLFLAATAGAALVLRLAARPGRWVRTPLDLPMAGLLALMLLSFIPAMANGASVGDWFRQIAPFLGLIFFFLLKNEVRDLKALKILSIGYLVTCLLYSYRILESIWIGRFSLNRVEQVRGHLDSVAFSVILFSFAGFLLGAAAVTPRQRTARIYMLLLVVTTGIHLLTITRSVIPNLFLAVLFFLFALWTYGPPRYRIERTVVVLGGLVGIVLVVALAGWFMFGSSGSFYDAYTARLSRNIGQINRWAEITSAFEALAGSPIYGLGMGVPLLVRKVHQVSMNEHVHNIFAYFAFTLGSSGLLVFFWLLLRLARLFLRSAAAIPDGLAKTFFFAHSGALLSIFFESQLAAGFRHFIFSLYLSMGFAILAALHHAYRGRVPAPAARRVRTRISPRPGYAAVSGVPRPSRRPG